MRGLLKCIFIYVGFVSVASAGPGQGPLSPEEPPNIGEFNVINFTLSDADSHILSMDSSSGLVTIDTLTNTIYLTTENGIREFSTSSALSAAGFNPSAIDFSQAFPGVDRSMLTMNPWNNNGAGAIGPCALSPCRTDYDPIDGRRILVPIVDYQQDTGRYPGLDPEVERDAIGFNNWREQRCDDFHDSVIASSAEAPGVALSCALTETVVGGFVCAGGLGKQAWDANRRASAMTDCNATYPGPGRWKGSTLPKGYNP